MLLMMALAFIVVLLWKRFMDMKWRTVGTSARPSDDRHLRMISPLDTASIETREGSHGQDRESLPCKSHLFHLGCGEMKSYGSVL